MSLSTVPEKQALFYAAKARHASEELPLNQRVHGSNVCAEAEGGHP